MPPEPKAAVIIPHYNDVARLDRCVAALWPQRVPEVEIVVVDNASSADLGPLRERWPDLRIVTETRRGAA